MTITAVKVSILDLYMTIFRVARFVKIVRGFIAFQILFGTVVLLQVLLTCRPLAFNWDRTLNGTCGNQTASYISVHIMNLILDLSIAALPMPVLWSLKMAVTKKVGISFLFSIGIM